LVSERDVAPEKAVPSSRCYIQDVADHITGMSLRDVRALLDNKSLGSKVIDGVDQVIGAALVFSPLVVGLPAGLILQSLLAPKDQLITICKNVVSAISKSDARDYLDQATNLAASHCLLTFAAYFDALNQSLPDVVKELKLTDQEKQLIATMGASSAGERDHPAMSADDLSGRLVAVPHPATPATATAIRLEIYAEMSGRLLQVVSKRLTAQSRQDQARLNTVAQQIPLVAERVYQAELTGLAIDFPQFFTWLVLTDQNAKDALIRKLGTDTQVRFELVGRTMDLGLRGLAEDMAQLRRAVAALPPHQSAPGLGQVAEGRVAEALHEIYARHIDRPVIDDLYQPERGPKLAYPSRAQCYVPQAYRLASKADTTTHLERDDAWTGRQVHDDLGPFLLRYLESAYATQGPLLILGHPGSGKSLLTQVLATRLAYPAYTTVRVELRDADPSADLQAQIEKQIRTDTGEDVSWAQFARTLPSPPVVILDGYDELLQATGSLHADYLDRVRRFQDREATLHRPVRVLVTSRITLIDKVTVPAGTTIVRLEEFDEQRASAWTGVWNACNAGYFAQSGVRPFTIPASPSILDLARQPLLLLMLAIYDAAGNELSIADDLDQTRLYHGLLSRFIGRELDKDREGFRQLAAGDQHAVVERELTRLGVAAVGMFNRQRLMIRREELDADLRYFQPEQDTPAAGARPLTQADLLLGSFFFIHESRSTSGAEDRGEAAPTSTFEFLHKTVGEFLTADFLLGQVLAEAEAVARLADRPPLPPLPPLPQTWFGCLIHTPLHTQPNVLQLLRQWAGHRLAEGTRPGAERLAALDTVVVTQLRALLTGTALPAPAAQDQPGPYAQLPALGRLAIYSLNLVVLRYYLSDGPCVLDEADLGEQPAGLRAWDRLTAIWRSWFSTESLSTLASQLTATRRDATITIGPDVPAPTRGAGTALSHAYLAGFALADEPAASSLGLHLASQASTRPGYLAELRERMVADAPELIPVADFALSRASWLPVAELPVCSYEYWHAGILDRRNTLPGYLPAGRELEFAEMMDRLALSPRQRADMDIAPTQMRNFIRLSRYAAEVVVHTADAWEPQWLLELLSANSPTAWIRLLRDRAGAPALRAALRRLDDDECAAVARSIASVLRLDSEVPFDADTAASVALLAWRGADPELAARSLDWIIGARRSTAWWLLDIPLQLWSGLADLFVSGGTNFASRRQEFSALLGDELYCDSAGMPRDSYFWTQAHWLEFLIHTTRIQGTGAFDTLRDKILRSDFVNPQVPRTTRRRWFLLVIRWARENDNREVVDTLFPNGTAAVNDDDIGYPYRWRELLGMPAGQPVNAETIEKVSMDLAYREAADLRWALDVLGGDRR
jgi:hypothetical protein